MTANGPLPLQWRTALTMLMTRYEIDAKYVATHLNINEAAAEAVIGDMTASGLLEVGGSGWTYSDTGWATTRQMLVDGPVESDPIEMQVMTALNRDLAEKTDLEQLVADVAETTAYAEAEAAAVEAKAQQDAQRAAAWPKHAQDVTADEAAAAAENAADTLATHQDTARESPAHHDEAAQQHAAQLAPSDRGACL